MKVLVDFASAPFWSSRGSAKGTVIAELGEDGFVADGISPKVWFFDEKDSIRSMRKALKSGERVIVDVRPDQVVRREG